MSKILTDKEMLDIIRRTVIGNEIDDSDQYLQFMEDLGDVIVKHFGGKRGTADFQEGDDDFYLAFNISEEVPEDGGIYKEYDTDVTWKNGEEN